MHPLRYLKVANVRGTMALSPPVGLTRRGGDLEVLTMSTRRAILPVECSLLDIYSATVLHTSLRPREPAASIWASVIDHDRTGARLASGDG